MHDPSERHDWGKSHRRRGQRSHQRRSAERHCLWESRTSSSLHRACDGGHIVNNSSISFLDLVTPHFELEQELTAVFQQVIRSAGFTGGPLVVNFDKAFA